MPFVIYSVQRLGLFFAALLALWALHLGGWLLVVLAAFLAWAVSYLALAGPRERAALWVSERVERGRLGPRFGAELESDAFEEDTEAAGLTPGSERQRSDGEAEPEQDAVAELEHAGPGQDGAEQDAPRPGEDRRAEQADGEREQQDQE